MTNYKIGLFGFGCVGQGFAELLNQNSQLSTEIVKVCVKHPGKSRTEVPGEVVYNSESILNDDSISIIVELIDDAQAAFDIVSKALKKGKSVVSANKKMIAENLNILDELQRKYGGELYYEGAVCGSIPIISNLRDYYAYDQINALSGIFNGSTNYILTKVIDENMDYEEALNDAKQNGFAESDPSLDVGGFDPSFKLALLISQAFNVYVNPNDIPTIGIEQISQADVRFASENGLKIKLLAHAYRMGNEIKAWVAPQFVEQSEPFASVDFEYNVIKVNSSNAGDQLLIGKGAGKLPTGLAVLSDVGSIVHATKAPFKKKKGVINKSHDLEVYIGFDSGTTVDLSLFSLVREKSIGRAYSYALGVINIENLSVLVKQYPSISLIVSSGGQKESQISKLAYRGATVADTV